MILKSVKFAHPLTSVTVTFPSNTAMESPVPFCMVAMTVQLLREPCPKVVTNFPSTSTSLSLGCEVNGTVSFPPLGSVITSNLEGIRKLNTLLASSASFSAWTSSYRSVEFPVIFC